MAQRQLIDLVVLGHLSATSAAQSPPPANRRLSLDSHRTSQSAPSQSMSGSTFLQHQQFSHHANNITPVSFSASASSTPPAAYAAISAPSPFDVELLFRSRSLSLGSAASKSADGCSGASSPGPPSPSASGFPLPPSSSELWPPVPDDSLTSSSSSPSTLYPSNAVFGVTTDGRLQLVNLAAFPQPSPVGENKSTMQMDRMRRASIQSSSASMWPYC